MTFGLILNIGHNFLTVEIGRSYLAYVHLIYLDIYNGANDFKHLTLTGHFDFFKTSTLPPRTYTMPCGALPDFV